MVRRLHDPAPAAAAAAACTRTCTQVNSTINYALEINGNSIGDFNMINERHALILERDNNEGDA